MRTVAVGLLVLILGTVAWAATGGDPLARQVSEVFVGTDDLYEGVPELIAQLEVSASIELGCISDPQWPAPPPGQKYMDWMPIPPPRGMAPFEFRRGTIKEALEAFCRLNPGLTWSQQDGVVNLVRHSEGEQALKSLLDLRVACFSVKGQAPVSTAEELAAALRAAEPKPPRESEGRWSLLAGPGRLNDVFPPRCAMDAPISLDRENATFRSLLDEVVRQGELYLWIALDDQRGAAMGEKRPPRAIVVVTDASPVRRKLDTPTLLRCLDAKYQPLHGYLDVYVRVEDAKRELRRRHHFGPEAIRQAMLAAHTIQSMLVPGPFAVEDRVAWLFSLEDPELSKLAMEDALKIEDRSARYRVVLLFPDPCSKDFDLNYLPIWKRLLSDSDERVRQRAETTLDWYRERQGRLGRQPAR